MPAISSSGSGADRLAVLGAVRADGEAVGLIAQPLHEVEHGIARLQHHGTIAAGDVEMLASRVVGTLGDADQRHRAARRRASPGPRARRRMLADRSPSTSTSVAAAGVAARSSAGSGVGVEHSSSVSARASPSAQHADASALPPRRSIGGGCGSSMRQGCQTLGVDAAIEPSSDGRGSCRQLILLLCSAVPAPAA